MSNQLYYDIENGYELFSNTPTQESSGLYLNGSLTTKGSIKAKSFTFSDGTKIPVVTKVGSPGNMTFIDSETGINNENPKKGLDLVGDLAVEGETNFDGKTVFDGRICFGKKQNNKMTLIKVGNSYVNGKWLKTKEIDLPKDVQFISNKPFTKNLEPIRISPYNVKIDLKRKKIIIKRADVQTGWSEDIHFKGYQRKPIKRPCLDSNKLMKLDKKFKKIKREVRKNKHLINKASRYSVIKTSLIRDKNMLKHLNVMHGKNRHRDGRKLINLMRKKINCSIIKSRWLRARRSSKYWLSRYRREGNSNRKRKWLKYYKKFRYHEVKNYRKFRKCNLKSRRRSRKQVFVTNRDRNDTRSKRELFNIVKNRRFSITTDLKLSNTIGKNRGWKNIFHLGNNNGERAPAMWLYPNFGQSWKVHFRIRTNRGTNNGYDFTIPKQYRRFNRNIRIKTNVMQSGRNLIIQHFINNRNVGRKILSNTTFIPLNNRRLFIRSPWYSKFRSGYSVRKVKFLKLR